MDEKTVDDLEREVKELKRRKELEERAADLKKQKKMLERQQTWWGQVALGLKISLSRIGRSLMNFFDAWTRPPGEDIGRQSGESFDAEAAQEELYKVMGGEVPETNKRQ